MMPTPRLQLRTRPTRSAFTLVELLVVIGIIIILMGILLPVIKHIRITAYVADTENEISQISNACNQYYTTFHSYPGPLSNDYIESTGTTPSTLTNRPLEIVLPKSTVTGGSYNITGAENLVLGLMGGLRLAAGTDNTVAPPLSYIDAFAPTEVGLGPLNLNPAFPGRTPSFFPNGTTYLMWCESTEGVARGPAQGSSFQSGQFITNNTVGTALQPVPFVDQAGNSSLDSPIPEFVDRFPTPGPMPILYLRARVGAQGVVSDGVVKDPTGAFALYQYDVREFAAYTVPTAGNPKAIGLPSGKQHVLQAVGGTPPFPQVAPANATFPTAGSDSLSYFNNPSISPTSATDINYSSRPRAVDQFILISAGPDGIYGTADDITSFGSVTP